MNDEIQKPLGMSHDVVTGEIITWELTDKEIVELEGTDETPTAD